MQKLPLLQRTCRDTVMFEDELMLFYLLPVKKMTLPPSIKVRLGHLIQVNTIEQFCFHSKLCLGGMSQNC